MPCCWRESLFARCGGHRSRDRRWSGDGHHPDAERNASHRHSGRRFGKEAAVGGVCKVAATIDPDARIVQLAQFRELAYGERNGSVSPRMERLHAFMQGASFDARLSRSIEYEMWEKWLMLATLGGITCLMRGNIGEVVAAPGGASFILSFLGEVVSVVSAVGEAGLPGGRPQDADDTGFDAKPVDVSRPAARQPDRGGANHRRPPRARRESGHRDAASRLRIRAFVRLSATASGSVSGR
jgi:hypothetical protein